MADLADCFNIHNIRLIEGNKGMFLSMPDVKKRDGNFRDLCYPTNTNFRTSLTEAVITAYNAKIVT
ncbi:MAG: SpoVG family protein [Clostridia bacterium]